MRKIFKDSIVFFCLFFTPTFAHFYLKIIRHLESVRPLVDDEEYEKFVNLSKDFEATQGSKLQRWLKLKWWTSDNYVSDWWEEYVYLRGRSPIMINSNYYCIDTIQNPPTHVQAARAGQLVHLAFQFRRALAKQELTPIIVNNLGKQSKKSKLCIYKVPH